MEISVVNVINYRRSQFLNAHSWKYISYVIFKTSLVSVVSGEIIFYVVSKFSVVIVEIIFYVVPKISVVSVIIGEIIFFMW